MIGQSAGADHADGLGDDFPDVLADAERCELEGDEHDPTLVEWGTRPHERADRP